MPTPRLPTALGAAVAGGAVMVALFGGCAGRPGDEPGAPRGSVSASGVCDLAFGPSCSPEPSASGTPASGHPASVTGRWKGTYTCGQGLTGLDLDITDQGGGSVSAVFTFGPVETNPGVPNGSYSMTGRLEPDLLTLTPKAWIVHPAGYVMVGLQASLPGDDPDVLAGTVVDAPCTTFRVER